MKSALFLPVLALLLASPVFAQNQRPPSPVPQTLPQVVLTPTQTAHILKELEKVEGLIGQGRSGIFSAALTKFREAMASDSAAVALYLDCYKLENFERKDLKQTDFMDWRERNEARLKDEEFKKGLLLQLEYLVMTIQAQDIEDPKKMGPLVTALQTFMAKAITAVQGTTKHTASGAVEAKDAGSKGGGQRKGGGNGGGGGQGGSLMGTLRQSVKGTEFANAYLLGDFLDRKDWEYSPLEVASIYSNVIFPYYLAEKPSEVPAQWDARINSELALRKAVMSESEFNLFYKEQGPRLQWDKNRFLLTHNLNAVSALADMLKIIQSNPNHADAAGWLKDFREIVNNSSESEPVPVEKPIGSQ